MDEDILRLRVGIFVVIAICILGILIFLNGEGLTWQYNVGVKTRTAPGVKRGTPIRKYGVLIGRVQEVEVVSTPTEDVVLLTFGINSGEKIYENEIVSIGSESLLGDAGIEILPAADGNRGPALEREGKPEWLADVEIRQDPFKMISDIQPQINSTITEVQNTLTVMQQAGLSVDDAGKKMSDLTSSIQKLLQEDESELKAMLTDFRQTSQKARDTLEDFDRVFRNINSVLEDPELKGKVRDTIANLPRVVEKVLDTLTATRETVRKFGSIPDDAHVSFANIDELTEQLNRLAPPEVLDQINASLKNADELFKQANKFAITLNELELEDGTVGKLLNDPAIYDAILETVRNVEETSIKLEPLINDLRMFADAIARNPGAIAKGALRRGGDGNYKGTAGRNGGILK